MNVEVESRRNSKQNNKENKLVLAKGVTSYRNFAGQRKDNK